MPRGNVRKTGREFKRNSRPVFLLPRCATSLRTGHLRGIRDLFQGTCPWKKCLDGGMRDGAASGEWRLSPSVTEGRFFCHTSAGAAVVQKNRPSSPAFHEGTFRLLRRCDSGDGSFVTSEPCGDGTKEPSPCHTGFLRRLTLPFPRLLYRPQSTTRAAVGGGPYGKF